MAEDLIYCSWSEYVQLDGITQSSLKELRRSPAHYLQAVAMAQRPNAAMVLGTATHTAVLEPDRFLLDYVLWEGGRRYGKEWDAFVEAAGEKTILTPEQYETACGIRDSVRSHREAAPLLEDGAAEVALLWQDEVTALGCKGRVDWLVGPPRLPVLVGLKTTRDASPHEFAKLAYRFGYNLQWAYYHDGYRAITGHSPRMVEIVAETSPPYDVVVYEITDETLRVGRDEYRRLLALLKGCVETDSWPGQAPDRVVEFSLPTWVERTAAAITIGGESCVWS